MENLWDLELTGSYSDAPSLRPLLLLLCFSQLEASIITDYAITDRIMRYTGYVYGATKQRNLHLPKRARILCNGIWNVRHLSLLKLSTTTIIRFLEQGTEIELRTENFSWIDYRRF